MHGLPRVSGRRAPPHRERARRRAEQRAARQRSGVPARRPAHARLAPARWRRTILGGDGRSGFRRRRGVPDASRPLRERWRPRLHRVPRRRDPLRRRRRSLAALVARALRDVAAEWAVHTRRQVRAGIRAAAGGARRLHAALRRRSALRRSVRRGGRVRDARVRDPCDRLRPRSDRDRAGARRRRCAVQRDPDRRARGGRRRGQVLELERSAPRVWRADREAVPRRAEALAAGRSRGRASPDPRSRWRYRLGRDRVHAREPVVLTRAHARPRTRALHRGHARCRALPGRVRRGSALVPDQPHRMAPDHPRRIARSR